MLNEINTCVGGCSRFWHLGSPPKVCTVAYYLELGRTGVKSQPCHSLPVRPWAGHLISLSFSFPSYKMGFVLTLETGLNRNSSIGCCGPVVTTWFLADVCSVPLFEPTGSRHCPISVCHFPKATSSTYMPFPMIGSSLGPGWASRHDQRL